MSTTATLEAIGCSVRQLDWRAVGRDRIDLVLLHWPNDFFTGRGRLDHVKRLVRAFIAKRRFGTRFVWVAHNLQPHDRPVASSRWTTTGFFRMLDGIIFLSAASSTATTGLYGRLPRVARLVTVHGRYDSDRAIVPPPADPDCVRLLHFGRVRPYKNIEALIDAAKACIDDRLVLTVTGYCEDRSYGETLLARADDHPRIRLDLRDEVLADDEIEAAIDAADGIVLPYRAVLNSGAAIHALSRARPVLVPALGSLPELAEDIGADWVSNYAGDIDASVLAAFADLVRRRAPDARPDLSAYGWDRVERDVRGFLDRLGLGR